MVDRDGYMAFRNIIVRLGALVPSFYLYEVLCLLCTTEEWLVRDVLVGRGPW